MGSTAWRRDQGETAFGSGTRCEGYPERCPAAAAAAVVVAVAVAESGVVAEPAAAGGREQGCSWESLSMEYDQPSDRAGRLRRRRRGEGEMVVGGKRGQAWLCLLELTSYFYLCARSPPLLNI